MHKVAAFYQFIALPHAAEIVPRLHTFCQARDLRGTVLVAAEGLNGTLAGPAEGIDELAEALTQGSIFQPALDHLELKFSTAEDRHFDRLKIKLKSEIITFNQPQANPTRQVGTYISPQDWNALIDDPETLVLDTRNGFEVAMGQFTGALNPGITCFTEFAHFVDTRLGSGKNTKIAMYCTGGIRCEKASAFMLERGFPKVFHLRGGILKYLETIPPAESRWQGTCFVFDRRVALSHGLVAHPQAQVPPNAPSRPASKQAPQPAPQLPARA